MLLGRQISHRIKLSNFTEIRRYESVLGKSKELPSIHNPYIYSVSKSKVYPKCLNWWRMLVQLVIFLVQHGCSWFFRSQFNGQSVVASPIQFIVIHNTIITTSNLTTSKTTTPTTMTHCSPIHFSCFTNSINYAQNQTKSVHCNPQCNH